MIELNRQTDVSLRVGESATYEVRVHGDVARDAEYVISDPTVMQWVETTSRSLRGPQMKERDLALRTYRFKAFAPGATTLSVRQTSRGHLDDVHEIKITVVP